MTGKLDVGACRERIRRKEFDKRENVFIKMTFFPP
jgi:hypothetical protein